MATKRHGLGRGLGALIPQAPDGSRPVDVFFPTEPEPRQDLVTTDIEQVSVGEDRSSSLRPVPGVQFAEIPLSQVRPNPRQPRREFDRDELTELAASIAEIGLLQPIVVRQIDEDGYELVVGERRLRAAGEAGLATLPAIIRDVADDELLRDALLENLHRSQLNPLEEAAAYQQLLDDFGCTQEELAKRIHRSRPQISNTIRLLRLPASVQRRVAAGIISAGHARALLGLSDPEAMEELAIRIVAEGLSVRAVEEIVMLGSQVQQVKKNRSRQTAETPPELVAVANRLSDLLDTRVKVAMGSRRGRITVEFAGAEDLERIVAILTADNPAANPSD
jgi:ParB family chromosome partitioning protein